MNFPLQPTLENEFVILKPLEETDFEDIYHAASNPKVWEQHPNPDRYKREVFQNFFTGAMQSKGAFKIIDKATGQVAGSSRFYDYNSENNTILIGYTFYATEFWGTGINHIVKRLMMDYAFQYVDAIIYHVGAENYRSQISIQRLGAKKIDEQLVEYFGESPKLNFIFEIKKADFV